MKLLSCITYECMDIVYKILRNVRLDRETSEGSIAASWSGGVNVGTGGHDACHLSLLV